MRSLVLTLLLGCLSTLHAQNFIINGNFNTSVPNNGTGGNWTSFNVESIGWSATGGNPGARFLLNASGQAGTDPTIEQIVAGLSIGQSYTVKGDYLIHVPLGNGTNSFGVLIDGSPILQIGNPGTTWTPFSVDFVATSSSHIVGFASERNGSDHSYLIDNIQLVVAVPEPATLAIIGLGVAVPGCVATRWVRRRNRFKRRK